MTRRLAKETVFKDGIDIGIDTVFDDFESRVCGECIYSKFEDETNDKLLCTNMLALGWWSDVGVTLDETCRKFERKDDT